MNSYRIIWDNDEQNDFNDIQLGGRSEELRLSNMFLIFPGEIILLLKQYSVLQNYHQFAVRICTLKNFKDFIRWKNVLILGLR